MSEAAWDDTCCVRSRPGVQHAAPEGARILPRTPLSLQLIYRSQWQRTIYAHPHIIKAKPQTGKRRCVVQRSAGAHG